MNNSNNYDREEIKNALSEYITKTMQDTFQMTLDMVEQKNSERSKEH